jgi:phosphohistidine phosphatase
VQVVLIRHAEGVVETLAVPDPTRYLSVTGRHQARELGEHLRRRGCAPTAVWTSPLVRAVQTAELVIAGMVWDGVPIAQPELAPTGEVRSIERLIRDGAESDVVLVVGHEPGLSALAGVLSGDTAIAALRKAEALCVDGGKIAWRTSHDSTQAM